MASDLEPLEPRLAPIVDELKTELREAPSGSRERVRARLDGSLGGGGGGGSGGGSSLSKGIALATFVAGVAIGAAWSPRGKPMEVPRPVAREASAPPVIEERATAPAVTTSILASATSAPSAPTAAPRPSAEHDDLAEERSLLDAARTALLRRDASSTLTMLQKHAARYPNGRLAEERDAMTVQALALDGKIDAARARRDAFERRYPKSLFLPSVRAATESSP